MFPLTPAVPELDHTNNIFGNKFFRRPDLTTFDRLQIVYEALCAKIFGHWGMISALAKYHNISRTFIYNTLAVFEEVVELALGEPPQQIEIENKREYVELMIVLRLEGKCSVGAISTIMKRLNHRFSGQGTVSTYLNHIGSLVPSGLMTEDNVRLVFLSDEVFSGSSPHSNFFVVNSQDQLIGTISIHDIRRIIYEYNKLELVVIAYDLMKPIQQSFTPTDSLDIVMKALGPMGIDELPVVKGENGSQLLGTVAKDDVIDAYNKEMVKRDMITSVSGAIGSMGKFKRIELMDGQILCEIEVPGAFIGKTLQELDLRSRYGTEVIMIKQNFNIEKNEKQHVMMPQPDYHFAFGDSVLIMGSQESLNKIEESN